MKIRALHFLLFLLLAPLGGIAAQPSPEPSAPLFREKPFGPRPVPTLAPARSAPEPQTAEQIPLSWIIGGALAAALAIAILLLLSVRRWQSSNLFDRQYRFPVGPAPALRFGARKSGGHLARVDLAALVRQDGSKAKDT